MATDNVCVTVNEQGFLYATSQPISECASYVMVSRSTYDSFIADMSVTGEQLTEAFTYGFAAVIVFGYFAAYPVGIAKKLIRKV
ncbi:single-stranded DNA-binding protein [Photobacterium ganghwense]|uniref:single-stranded DNA-binding protein n=1 Tax=Photobacterium ganghwense TaxID=320778 RepID=UPI001A8DF942|nr:single-stranded DNA-binding protein [Photobacterium ganghwense]QSV15463.1 single-stranded DNA-binding protein [Photobacterium ganghwense]QSV17344.1 single-stranded DNA-binding protein [Photobacterium ganghwense]